jgi:hypothetical protein
MELLNLTYAESSVNKLVHALLEFYSYHGTRCACAVLCKQRRTKPSACCVSCDTQMVMTCVQAAVRASHEEGSDCVHAQLCRPSFPAHLHLKVRNQLLILVQHHRPAAHLRRRTHPRRHRRRIQAVRGPSPRARTCKPKTGSRWARMMPARRGRPVVMITSLEGDRHVVQITPRDPITPRPVLIAHVWPHHYQPLTPSAIGRPTTRHDTMWHT